jgi:uncharacterized membrane protein
MFAAVIDIAKYRSMKLAIASLIFDWMIIVTMAVVSVLSLLLLYTLFLLPFNLIKFLLFVCGWILIITGTEYVHE